MPACAVSGERVVLQEPGEQPSDTIVREVKEEATLEIRPEMDWIGEYSEDRGASWLHDFTTSYCRAPTTIATS